MSNCVIPSWHRIKEVITRLRCILQFEQGLSSLFYDLCWPIGAFNTILAFALLCILPNILPSHSLTHALFIILRLDLFSREMIVEASPDPVTQTDMPCSTYNIWPVWLRKQCLYNNRKENTSSYCLVWKDIHLVWNGVHSASWVQLRSYLIEK
jgi:hypothetical protein